MNASNLSPDEREVWKQAYLYHEKWNKMTGSYEEWIQAAKELPEITARYTGSEKRLAECILLAVYNYLSEETKLREETAKKALHEEEQMSMDIGGFRWT